MLWCRVLLVGVVLGLANTLVPSVAAQSSAWEHVYQVFGSCAPNDSGPPILELATSTDGRHYFSDPGNLFRTTDDGLSWDRPLFQLIHIEGILPMSADTLLIGLWGSAGGIYRATLFGDTWEQTSVVGNMRELVATDDRALIFAIPAGPGLYLSKDRGLSWRNVQPNREISALRISPSGRMYLDGSGVFTSTNGEDWTASTSTRFPFQTADPTIFLATDTEGVYRSVDEGVTWSLVQSSNSPALVRNREGNIVLITKEGLVSRSIDNGQSWIPFITNPPSTCGIRSSVSIDEEGRVWFGNNVGGVFRSFQTTHVGLTRPELPTDQRIIDIYPNPASELINISVELSHPENIMISVVDLLGRTVDVLYAGFKPSGKHLIVWQSPDLPSGQYVIRLSGASGNSSQLFTIYR